MHVRSIFYIDILGTKKLNETYRVERDSYKLDLSFPDGSQIELFSFPNPPQRVTNPEACGLRHLAFKVENIDEYVAYLLENSIDCEPIRVDELTGMKYTFFRHQIIYLLNYTKIIINVENQIIMSHIKKKNWDLLFLCF